MEGARDHRAYRRDPRPRRSTDQEEAQIAEQPRGLDFTLDFLESLIRFPASDQKRFLKALRLLDENEKHPSLRVHQLSGDLAGTWSASASDELRVLFVRTAGGRKALIRCTRHYLG